MELKERFIPASPETSDCLISPAPTFDFDKADQARDLAGEYLGQLAGVDNFCALKIALTLAVYNYLVANHPDQREIGQFWTRFDRLIWDEVNYSPPGNPLPTIGIEVESPRKAHPDQDSFATYGRLFDGMGMPRNKINMVRDYSAHNPWEFSPPPSYSAAVQARILCELIKGGFIPSLVSSRNPDDIIAKLDDKLISLHINLGYPRGTNAFINDYELVLFAAAFAFAFTSPQRLERRSSSVSTLDKDGDSTGKSQQRLELKAFEVRDKSVYRLLRQVQLIGAAFFAYESAKHTLLSIEWETLRSELFAILNEAPRLEDKPAAARYGATGDISGRLRDILGAEALVIAKIIRSHQVNLVVG